MAFFRAFNCRILYGLYLPTVILRPTVIWYSVTHSLFLSRLFPTAALPFFYLNIYYVDSPDCLLLFLSISVFYFLFFSVF